MKRKSIKVLAAIFTLLLMTVLATACSCTSAQRSNEYLYTCDFSFDNVAEIKFTVGCPSETYSIKKGDSIEGDEIITQVLEAWTTFQEGAFFTDKINGNDKAIVGSTLRYECIFVDGSYVSIYSTSRQNYELNNFGECQLKDKEVYKVFYSAYSLMEKDEYLIEEE